MKKLLIKLVQLRNPNFTLHHAIDNRILFSFCTSTALQLLRGLRVLWFFRKNKGAMFGSGVSLQYIHKISWGRFLKLGKQIRISALGTDGVHLGNNVSIGSYSSLIVSTTLDQPGLFIKLEDNIGIGEHAYLGGAGGLHIGSDCIIGQYFSCHPENHHFQDEKELIRCQGTERKGISIGPNCWIGSKVTLTDGVTLGAGCVVAAGAVVTKSFPKNSIIGGVPAQLIKHRLN